MAAPPPPPQQPRPAASSSAAPKVPPCHTMEEYDQLLRQRRRELDREIEAFHARKEKEYILFQRSLRAELNAEKDRQRGAEAAAVAEEKQQSSGKAKATESAPGEAGDAPADGPVAPAQQQHPLRARDAELRGLFTPSYLPLLEASTDRSTHADLGDDGATSSGDEGGGGVAKGKQSANRRRKRSSAPLPLSSSLTLSRSAYDDGSAAPQASSAPRPGLADRRSSSRSDSSVIGGNLRSVLRQPRSPEGAGGGKSPKHVLFSIDNTVVAPSSSPSLTRHGSKDFEAAEMEALLQDHPGSDLGTSTSKENRDDPASADPAATPDASAAPRPAADLAASARSMRGVPPGLRMTPVRVPNPPTPPLGSLKSSGEYFNVPARSGGSGGASESAVSPTSQPSPAAPLARSDPNSASHPASVLGAPPLAIDVAAASYGAAMRRTSSGSAPRTPSSATRAADLLEPTVPPELQESAGGVPDVLDGSADPLFDFEDGDADGFEDVSSDDGEEMQEVPARGAATDGGAKASKKKARGRHDAASDDSDLENGDGGGSGHRRRRTPDAIQGALPASLPIEIKWPVRRRS